jgi:hypothetical protein
MFSRDKIEIVGGVVSSDINGLGNCVAAHPGNSIVASEQFNGVISG